MGERVDRLNVSVSRSSKCCGECYILIRRDEDLRSLKNRKSCRNGITERLKSEGLKMKMLMLGLIRVYRISISPLFPPSCRFQPTCSQYALEAIERFGAWRGGWMAFRRVLRCHPLHPGGYDPVPLATETASETIHSHEGVSGANSECIDERKTR